MCNVKKAAAGSNGHTGRTSGICGISQYAILPDEDEDTKSKKTDNSTDTVSSEDNRGTKGEVTTDDEDPLETIRQAIAANGTVLEAPKQNAADSTDTESTAEAQPEKTKAGTVTVVADSGHTGTVKTAGKTAAFCRCECR